MSELGKERRGARVTTSNIECVHHRRRNIIDVRDGVGPRGNLGGCRLCREGERRSGGRGAHEAEDPNDERNHDGAEAVVTAAEKRAEIGVRQESAGTTKGSGGRVAHIADEGVPPCPEANGVRPVELLEHGGLEEAATLREEANLHRSANEEALRERGLGDVLVDSDKIAEELDELRSELRRMQHDCGGHTGESGGLECGAGETSKNKIAGARERKARQRRRTIGG
jgi:hypothetical protein